jgi:hypothetical protein
MIQIRTNNNNNIKTKVIKYSSLIVIIGIIIFTFWHLYTQLFGLCVLVFLLFRYVVSCMKFYGAKTTFTKLLSADLMESSTRIQNFPFILINSDSPDTECFDLFNKIFKRGVWNLMMQDYPTAKDEFILVNDLVTAYLNIQSGHDNNRMIELQEKCKLNINFCNKPFPWSQCNTNRKKGGYIDFFLMKELANQHYIYSEIKEDIQRGIKIS